MDILSNEDLKNRLLYSLRNGKFPKNVVGRAEKLGRKLRSFALPVLMAASSTSVADMSASSGGWHAVSSSANNLTTSVGSDGAEKKIASKDKKTISFEEMRNFEVVDDFSGLKNRDNLKIDASGVTIKLSDMERAAGEESEQMKKAWDTSLNINVGSRRCTKAMKKLLRKLGMVTSEAMENGFDGVVPAWGLIPFFDRGDIRDVVPIKVEEDAQERKTMPIIVFKINEKGETVFSHCQVMGPQGASYGEGRVSASPNYHRRGNKRLKYGRAHFYVDKGTFFALLKEMVKVRPDLVTVLDKKNDKLLVFDERNLPERYKNIVAYHKMMYPVEEVLEQMKNPDRFAKNDLQKTGELPKINPKNPSKMSLAQQMRRLRNSGNVH